MRKRVIAIIGIYLSVAMAVSAASGDFTDNVVGYQRVDLAPAGEFILTGSNFETGETNTLLSIFGTNSLTQANHYINCDRIHLYDQETQSYKPWAQWTNGVFYKATDLTEWNASIAGNPEVPLGEGFFIARSSAATGPKYVVYSGDVIQSASVPVALGPGYQIICYPFSSDIELQNTSFFTDGAAADDSLGLCDSIQFYKDGIYNKVAVWTDGQWYMANNGVEWGQNIIATNVIQMGQAVFYEAQTNIIWTEPNPYLGHLTP